MVDVSDLINLVFIDIIDFVGSINSALSWETLNN